ncbi:Tn3 family transposase [Streptosporangium vulgare]|uniref:Tn3 family transposase n=1 Tax=Streptosporangium vulgare TaxID=46190 RepID=UPI0031E094D3
MVGGLTAEHSRSGDQGIGGASARTIHAARDLSDPVYRRKISRQLNKGESLHALRRDLHYAQQGTIVRPHLTDQTEQSWCLTILTNAVITCYLGREEAVCNAA